MSDNKPKLKLTRIKKAPCWICEGPEGMVVIYPAQGRELDSKTANWLLDRAKSVLHQ